jgi:carboxyl-terminal processing protease
MTALRVEPLPTGSTDDLPSADPIWQRVRLIVLVDEQTAASAELFAQALREHRGAVLVGTRTMGLVRIEQSVSLPNGAQLKVPRGTLLGSNKAVWAGVGLLPDVPFGDAGRSEYGAADDQGLARALQLLKSVDSAP